MHDTLHKAFVHSLSFPTISFEAIQLQQFLRVLILNLTTCKAQAASTISINHSHYYTTPTNQPNPNSKKLTIMPNHSNKVPFTLCDHTTPPTFSPALPPSPANTTTPTRHYPFRCLGCDISTRYGFQSLELETYNGEIYDLAIRIRMMQARLSHLEHVQVLEEGRQTVRNLERDRAIQVHKIWTGFLDRWNSPAEGGLELRLAHDGEGGYRVEGVPEGVVIEGYHDRETY